MNWAAQAMRAAAAVGASSGRANGRITADKTRQGYARKRILKLAGYFFVRCAA